MCGIILKEAMIYSVKDNLVNCNLCARFCKIKEGQVGFCRVRKNINGKLYSLVYDKVISANPDPIQKKPLFHFAPGTMVFSIATPGCNFKCEFCCNWAISQKAELIGEKISPEQIVNMAIKSGCQGISYTYTEPTIFFELAYDTAKIAKNKGLFNTFVTNGYITPEAIKKISPYLDAATVDFKGSANKQFYLKKCGVPKVEPIFDAISSMRDNKIFIEITNLIIPEIGEYKEDLKKLVIWINNNLGPETPLHLLAFFPSYKIQNLPRTSTEMINQAIEIAESNGLKHVYSGNVPGHSKENTYCPKCGNIVIERYNVYLRENNLKNGACPKCGYKLNVI
jgi:pyruvate formate lyase activating enzyme